MTLPASTYRRPARPRTSTENPVLLTYTFGRGIENSGGIAVNSIRHPDDSTEVTHFHVHNDRTDLKGAVALRYLNRLTASRSGAEHRHRGSRFRSRASRVRVVAEGGSLLRELTLDAHRDHPPSVGPRPAAELGHHHVRQGCATIS